jgi:hypothetical protein
MSDAPLPDVAALDDTLTLNGAKVRFAPLKIEDFAAWDRWARRDFLEGTLPAVSGIEDELEHRRQSRYLHESAERISFGSPNALGQMFGFSGKLVACWLSMKRAEGPAKRGQVEMTMEMAWTTISGSVICPQSYRNLNDAMGLVLKLSGLVTEAAASDPTKLVGGVAELMS